MMEETPVLSLRRMLHKSLSTFENTQNLPEDAAEHTPLEPMATPVSRGEEGFPSVRTTLSEQLLQIVDSCGGQDGLLKAAAGMDAAGQGQAAMLLYRLSVLLHPSAKAYNNIAVLYADQDEEDIALEWLERGLERFPHDATLRENYEIMNQDA